LSLSNLVFGLAHPKDKKENAKLKRSIFRKTILIGAILINRLQSNLCKKHNKNYVLNFRINQVPQCVRNVGLSEV
jgi:hypothetical protein